MGAIEDRLHARPAKITPQERVGLAVMDWMGFYNHLRLRSALDFF